MLEHVRHHHAVEGAGREHREVVRRPLEEDEPLLQAEPPRVRARLGRVRMKVGLRLRLRLRLSVRLGARLGVRLGATSSSDGAAGSTPVTW